MYFVKATQIWKNNLLRFLEASKRNGRYKIFSNFVAFSEYFNSKLCNLQDFFFRNSSQGFIKVYLKMQGKIKCKLLLYKEF